jgi:hypothetical protein
MDRSSVSLNDTWMPAAVAVSYCRQSLARSLRTALTHSEPNSQRSLALGMVIWPDKAARFAGELREVAKWLWRGQMPEGAFGEFDRPNASLQD